MACLRQNGWKREKEKKKKKNSRQRYLRTLGRSVVPWRCTTRFRPAVRLCQPEMVPRCFPIPCPRQDSEGEKSRPLDHMRQIPFVGTSVPPYWLKLRFGHVYIWQCSHFVFHVVSFEVWAYQGLKRYNDRRMTRGQTTCSLGGTASLGLRLHYLILTIFIAVFPKTVAPSLDRLLTLLGESGRHSKSSVKAVAIFLSLAIKSTLITVPGNENVPRLLLQQLRCYVSPLDVWWHRLLVRSIALWWMPKA